MTLKNKLIKTLETLTNNKNENIDCNSTTNQANQYAISKFTDEFNSYSKIRELETIISNLSAKMTVMSDKVNELNDKINNLTLLNEELLYTIDQAEKELNQQEDNDLSVRLSFNEKKHSLN